MADRSDEEHAFPEPPEGLLKSAARIVGSHGGHDMAHFGRGHWEPLGTGA